MKLKKLLKQPKYKNYTTIEIIDIPKHWSIVTHIQESFYTKPLEKYFRKTLKRKVEKVYTNNNTILTVEIY